MTQTTSDPVRTPPVEFDAVPTARLVQITSDAIRRALDAWRRDAPPELRGLLDARPMR